MSYVYFIEAEMPGGLVKIGVAKDPQGRMQHFRAGSPVPLKLLKCVAGASRLEKQLHAKFNHLRQHGEWFSFGDDLKAFLREMEEADALPDESLLTVGEAAAFLETTEAKVRELCRKGVLQPVYTRGGHRRFRSSQLSVEPHVGVVFDFTEKHLEDE